MLFTRLLVQRITFNFLFRLKSTEINFVDELNKIKSKDLMKIFNEEQTKQFLQLRQSLGGKFHSLQQFRNESKIPIDCKSSTSLCSCFSSFVILVDEFFGYLLSLKNRNDEQQYRIHIEPRVTEKTAAVNEFSQQRTNRIGFI